MKIPDCHLYICFLKATTKAGKASFLIERN